MMTSPRTRSARRCPGRKGRAASGWIRAMACSGSPIRGAAASTRVDTKTSEMSFIPFPNPTEQPALPRDGRQQSQRVGLDVDHRPDRKIRTVHRQVDACSICRPAGPKSASCRRATANGGLELTFTLSALEQDRGDDVPQRGRPRGAQASGAIASAAHCDGRAAHGRRGHCVSCRNRTGSPPGPKSPHSRPNG